MQPKSKKAQLNELVTQYKETGREDYFTQAFELCEKHITSTAKKYARHWTRITTEDFISEGNLRFYKAVQAYDRAAGDFERVLNRTLRNAFVSMTRSTELKLEFTERYQTDSEGVVQDRLETTIIEGVTLDASLVAEGSILAEGRTRVVDALLDSADLTTYETALEYVETGSFAEAGRKLGVSHTTVKRRLEALEKRYDYRTFGPIMDYMGGGNVYATK